MLNIAVNGKYLAPRYRFSGFGRWLSLLLGESHSYAREMMLSVLIPEGTDIALWKSSPGIHFFTLVPASEPFEDACAQWCMINKPDLLFLPHAEFPSHKLPAIPTVAVVHDVIPTWFLRPGMLFRGKTPAAMITMQGLTDYFRLRRRLPQLRAIITVSRTSEEILARLFGPRIASRTRVVHGAVDPLFRHLMMSDCAEAIKPYELAYGKYLLYFGGHTVRKNVGRVVLAWHSLTPAARKEHPLVILGNGYWRDWIFNRGLTAGITFIDTCPPSDLAALIGGAAATLYPSLFEGFGLPVVESLACGTFPILSAIPTTYEICGEDFPAFDPYSVPNIAGHIAAALSNPAQSRELTQHARARLTEFTPAKMAEAVIDVLKAAAYN